MMSSLKLLKWLLFIGAVFVCASPVAAQQFDLLQWDYRVLVLSADEDSSDAEEQVLLLGGHLEAIEEREIMVLRLTSQVLRKVDGVSPFPFQTQILESRQERRYLEGVFPRDVFGDGALSVTLVGFDGGVKRVWDGVVEPKEIFEAIDSMPMRQRELSAQ